MQTFLPFASFRATAHVLDRQRLGSQRKEVLQILNTLAGVSQGWRNHPAVKMWAGFEPLLIDYGLAICHEWVERTYTDNCARAISAHRDQFGTGHTEGALPRWLGNDAFHRSHRSNLTRKNPEWYGQFWQEPADLPYIWPSKEAA